MDEVVETVAPVRVSPWWRTGQDISGASTVEEALATAGLDWGLKLQPAYYRVKDSFKKVEGRNVTVRTDTNAAMGVVGSNYQAFTNQEAFSFCEGLFKGDTKPSRAGEFRGGRWVWMEFAFQEGVEIAGVDTLRSHLFFTTSHDGSRSITGGITTVNIRCENTLNLAVASAIRKWSVPHLRTAGEKLQEAQRALETGAAYLAELQEAGAKLAGETFSAEQVRQLATQLLPNRPRRDDYVDEIVRVLETSDKIEDSVRFTKWGAINAIDEWLEWVKPARSVEAVAMSTLGGFAAQTRDRAMAALTR